MDRSGIFPGQEPQAEPESLPESLRDAYQELANVAMGQAADLLPRLLNVFVVTKTTVVNIFERSELHMALNQTEHSDTISAVSQGFLGSGIAGEALLIFNDSSFEDIARLIWFRTMQSSGKRHWR